MKKWHNEYFYETCFCFAHVFYHFCSLRESIIAFLYK